MKIEQNKCKERLSNDSGKNDKEGTGKIGQKRNKMRKFRLISPKGPEFGKQRAEKQKDAFFTALTTTCRKSQEAANRLPSLIQHYRLKRIKSAQRVSITHFLAFLKA